MTNKAAHPINLSTRGKHAEDSPISWMMAKALKVPGLISLAAGFVDQHTLPYEEFQKITHDLLADPIAGRSALQYGTTIGDSELRALILDQLKEQSGGAKIYDKLSIEDVLITSGSQQLLYLLIEALFDEGDIVLVGDPSYFVYVGALKSFNVKMIGIPTDADGMQPAALRKQLQALEKNGQLSKVKMLYIMSYFQNPRGANLSTPRRKEILEMFKEFSARGLNGILLEDAAYRDLRFEDPDLPAMLELQDENDFICYTQSFSKSLAPGLRMGVGIAPRKLIEVMTRIKSHHDFGSSNFCQQLVKKTIQTGVMAKHTAELRKRYKMKCEAMLEVLKQEKLTGLEYNPPQGGMYLWATLPEGIDTGMNSKLFKTCLEEKVLYVPGEVCAIPDPDSGKVRPIQKRSMRLCYGYPDIDVIQEGTRRLCRAIKKVISS